MCSFDIAQCTTEELKANLKDYTFFSLDICLMISLICEILKKKKKHGKLVNMTRKKKKKQIHRYREQPS